MSKLLLVAMLAAALVQVKPPAAGRSRPEVKPEISNSESGTPGSKSPDGRPDDVRFGVVDVVIDSGPLPLAAYQFELKVTAGDVTLVGVEGGECGGVPPAPLLRPGCAARQRIVIAAFDLGTDLPRGKTRVARLMVRVRGTVAPAYEATLAATAADDGKPVPATISVSDSSDPSTKPVSEGAGR